MSEHEQPEPSPPPAGDAPPPIEDAPPPLASPPSAALVSGSKADPTKRFVAILVDAIVGLVVFAVLSVVSRSLGWLGYAAYMLVRDGLDFDFMKQRSIGKQIMKLRVHRTGGGAMDLQTSLMRNWPLALSAVISAVLWLGGAKLWLALGWLASLAGLLGLVEAILVLVDPQGKRIGDKFANTSVVNE